MAYTKNTWATGDIVTSAKLNHMEDGIESGNSALICLITPETGYLDKTFGEILDAFASGKMVILHTSSPAGESDRSEGYFIMPWISHSYADETGEYSGTLEFNNYGTFITGIVNSYEELLAERARASALD